MPKAKVWNVGPVVASRVGPGLGRNCSGHGTENTLGRLWGAGRLLNRAVMMRPVLGNSGVGPYDRGELGC